MIVLLGLLIVSSIKLRLKLDETEKTVRVWYTLLRVEIDLSGQQGKLMLAGIKLRRFPLDSTKTGKAEKPASLPKKPKKKKAKLTAKKRRSIFDLLSYLKFKYFRKAGSLLRHIKFHDLMLRISGGFLEPFYTGKMFAYYCALKGACPSVMAPISFQPDFSSGSLRFAGKGLAHIRMYYILEFVCFILADLVKEKIKKMFTNRKKGVEHG